MCYIRPHQSTSDYKPSRAPPQILNVSPGQPVELRVVKRLQDNYVPSARARQAKAFSGHGQRLGSPAPTAGSSGSTTVVGESSGASSPIPGAFPSSADEPPRRAADSISARFEVDLSKPTTNIQIRLADGSRFVWHLGVSLVYFRLTHSGRSFQNGCKDESSAHCGRYPQLHQCVRL